MKRKPTEHEIQKQILDWLTIKRIFHWRNNSGAMRSVYKGKSRFMRFGAVGSPDIIAIDAGYIFGIEVKGPDGKLSENQRAFGEAFERAGGRYIVAYKIEDVTNCMED